jgi:hypothetical protein
MDEERTDYTIGDETLEREIENALDIDPSPEFLARVRARIASQRRPTGWHLSWRVVGVGAALAATVVMALVVTRSQRPPTASLSFKPTAATRTVESAPTGPPIATPSPALPTAASVIESTGRKHSRRATPNTGPEVLIATRDAAALRVLMMNMREGRVDLTALDALQAVAAPLEPLDKIAIQPIAIQPLPRLALLEGERP